MMIVGVDPGVNGAIAIMRENGTILLLDVPNVSHKIENKKTGKTRNHKDIDIEKLDALCYEYFNHVGCKIFIEEVHSMPGQGVASTFKFGKAFGTLIGMLSVYGKVHFVKPQEWKKHHGLIGKKKDDSRLLVIERYPSLKNELKLKKNVDKAEALLLCLYGQTKLRGEYV